MDPAEVLTHPRTHPRVRVAELAMRLRAQAFVAEMIWRGFAAPHLSRQQEND